MHEQRPRTYPHGVPSWVDTEQPDPQAAASFYGALFGWVFTDVVPPDAPGTYLVATLGGQDVAALGPLSPDTDPAGGAVWNTYLAVDDADATAARVAATGGTVLHGPADAGPGGRAAACSDSQGTPFALWQARRRLGAQLVGAPGAWSSSDLLTPDVEAALAFYAPLFGWHAEPRPEGGGAALRVPGYGDHVAVTSDPGVREHQAFAPEDAAHDRTGQDRAHDIGTVPPRAVADVFGSVVPVPPADRPRWRVTFTVADRDDAAATAERLGASVLRSGEGTWARTADLRDPQGAELMVSQLIPPGG